MEIRNSLQDEVVSSKADNEIVCDTVELKEKITEWLQDQDWQFENFADFLKLFGIETPVKLRRFNKCDNSFDCVTASGTKVCLALLFSAKKHLCSEIYVINPKQVIRYKINRNIEKGRSLPGATVSEKIIKYFDKELNILYGTTFYECKLKFKESDEIAIDIKTNEFSNFVLQDFQEIEEYLLGQNSLAIADVAEKINLGMKGTVRGTIFMMSNEQVEEYLVLEKGEVFHVFRNGDWRHVSDNGICIEYYKKEERYNSYAIGSRKSMSIANPGMLIDRIRTRISELMEFVK